MIYTLTLTNEQLGVINAGLQELPMKLAAPVVVAINQQLLDASPPEATEEPTD